MNSFPGLRAPRRRGLHTVSFEDVADRRVTDAVSELLRLTGDPVEAPTFGSRRSLTKSKAVLEHPVSTWQRTVKHGPKTGLGSTRGQADHAVGTKHSNRSALDTVLP